MTVRHLAPDALLDIRRAYWATAEPMSKIGKRHGIHRAEVYQIAQGISRRDEGEWPAEANPGDPRPARTVVHRTRLTDADVADIRAFFARPGGPRWGDVERVAKRYGLSDTYVADIIKGRARPDAGGPICDIDLRSLQPART